jgi:hypothetical protein
MQGRLDATIRTRRVLLIWQVKDNSVSDIWHFFSPALITVPGNDKWAKKWLDKLLPNDTSFVRTP